MVTDVKVFKPEGVFNPVGLSARSSIPAKDTGLSVVYVRAADSDSVRVVARSRSLAEHYFGAEQNPLVHGPVSSRWDAVVFKAAESLADTGVLFELHTHSNSSRHMVAGANEIRSASPVVDFAPLGLDKPKIKTLTLSGNAMTRVSASYLAARGASVDTESISHVGLDLSVGYVVQWNKRVYHRAVCNKIYHKTLGIWGAAYGKNPFIVQGWAVLLGLEPCDMCNPSGLRSPS